VKKQTVSVERRQHLVRFFGILRHVVGQANSTRADLESTESDWVSFLKETYGGCAASCLGDTTVINPCTCRRFSVACLLGNRNVFCLFATCSYNSWILDLALNRRQSCPFVSSCRKYDRTCTQCVPGAAMFPR